MAVGRHKSLRSGRLLAIVAIVGSVLASGCSQPRDAPLPALATQSPSKQPIMTPAEQQKAIDAMVAKRNAQAAETAARTGETRTK